MTKLSAKDKIIIVLLRHSRVAIHEFGIYYQQDFGEPLGVSENNIGTRLPEMRFGHKYRGKVYFLDGDTREGKPYSEWYIDRIEEPKERIEIAENRVYKTQMVLF